MCFLLNVTYSFTFFVYLLCPSSFQQQLLSYYGSTSSKLVPQRQTYTRSICFYGIIFLSGELLKDLRIGTCLLATMANATSTGTS
jgi:hypothetical protein